MTITVSIQNGSETRDVIIESRDGAGNNRGLINMSLAPGAKSNFVIWKEQTLLIREAMAGNRGVRLGDSVYETLNTAMILLLEARNTLEGDNTLDTDLAGRIDDLIKNYTGQGD